MLGKGLVRLRGLPIEPGSLATIAGRIGPIRPTNFGELFDVKAKPDPDSNAYTSIALPPHVDLPTREYHPGLQMLHCLENSVEGGQAVMLDGFAVAEALRDRHPEAFATLTRVRWRYANTAKTTDYVWHEPMIRLDARGELLEVRIADFLRGPLHAAFEDIEPAYEALMVLQRLLRDPAFAIRFTYRSRRPGDLRQPSAAARPRRLRGPERPSLAAGLLHGARRDPLPLPHDPARPSAPPGYRGGLRRLSPAPGQRSGSASR